MAFGNFGVSFLPGADGGPQDQNGFTGGASGVPPLQQAIKFLSLRLPRFAGPNAIAPPTLLNAAGGAGLPPDLQRMGGVGPSAFGPPRVGPGFETPLAPPPPRVGPGQLPGAPGLPTYQPGANQTSRGGGPFYRDYDAPVTGQAVPRSGLDPGADPSVGALGPESLMALFDRVRRGGYSGPGGI